MDVTPANFLDFGIHVAVNLVGLVVLTVGLYYRRHRRRDLLTCMVCFNISLFVALAVIDVRGVEGLGVGFGLFALLSIINLRSDPFSTVELGYFFSALVTGVVNGVEVGGGLLTLTNEMFAIMLTFTVVAVVAIIDHPRLHQGDNHQQITLDRVHEDPRALRTDLEGRLDAPVMTATVLHTDYVQQTMLVDVRYGQRREDAA